MKFKILMLLALSHSQANTFQNITSDAGINMPHSSASMSTGIAIGDFDNNGFPDLFYTGFQENSKLFMNQGDGTFRDDLVFVPNMSFAKCGSAAAADYNNDGFQDIYVSCLGNNYFLKNLGGNAFENVVFSSGTNHPTRTEAVSWGDLNNDGWLDLVLGVHPISFPVNLNDPNELDQFFMNNGDGTFSPLQSNIPREEISQYTLALILTDIDFDNDLDIYLANDRNQNNVMFRNDGPGCGGLCFTSVGLSNGAFEPAYSMGIAVADYDNDSDWDMSYSSIDEHLFLKNDGLNGNLSFTEQATAVGVNITDGTGWGTLMFDVDNDGWEDLFLATEPGTQPTTNILFQNNQDGTFTDRTSLLGLIDNNPTHAAAWLDFNKDGQLDLSYGRHNLSYELMKNTGGTNNWLAIELMGGLNINRDAIGTKVKIVNNLGLQMIRELRSGESRGSNNQMVLHFGMGASVSADATIIWPDGLTQEVPNIALNQYVKLVYPPYDFIFDSSFD